MGKRIAKTEWSNCLEEGLLGPRKGEVEFVSANQFDQAAKQGKANLRPEETALTNSSLIVSGPPGMRAMSSAAGNGMKNEHVLDLSSPAKAPGADSAISVSLIFVGKENKSPSVAARVKIQLPRPFEVAQNI